MRTLLKSSIFLRRLSNATLLLGRLFNLSILLHTLPNLSVLLRTWSNTSIRLCTLLLLIAATTISCEPESRDSASAHSPDHAEANRTGEPAAHKTGAELPDADVAFVTEKPVSHRFMDREVSLYGEQCDYTGREIRSRRYGAVMVHEEGEVLRFNSVESLLGYLDQSADPENESAASGSAAPAEDAAVIGIVDFISAERLMMPESLTFHYSRLLPSPGGSFISAMNPDADSELLYNISEAYPGQQYNWQELREHLENN